MPFFICVSSVSNLGELADFIRLNQGMIIYPGAYLLPWEGSPDLLTQRIRCLVRPHARVVVAAVADYWAVLG